MRWVFLSLVILNLLYLGYEMVSGQEGRRLQSSASREPSSSPQILLISEARDALVVRDDEAFWQQLSAQRRQQQADWADLCLELTGFADQDAARDWSQRFAGEAVDVGIREETGAIQSYWLYIPPFQSSVAAVSAMAALRDSGVNGYLINDGEQALGLSLGLWRSMAEIEQIKGLVEGLGYQVKVEKSQYEMTVSLLVLGFSEQLSPQALISDMGLEESGLNLEEKSCKAVASLYQFN